jgi:hypothetical protein
VIEESIIPKKFPKVLCKRGVVMIILKGNYGDYMKLRPVSVKKIFLDESMLRNNKDPDIYEKYIYEVEGRFGNYKWFNNEFNLEGRGNGKLDKLTFDIEYIPLILTILRINAFFKSKKKSMISVLASDHENQTSEIIAEESFIYSLNESNNLSFLFLRKIGKGLIEHHLIFTNDYGDHFDMYIESDRKSIESFYKNLLNETNNFRVAILPNIAQKISPFYEKIIEKIAIVNYENVYNITDDFFTLYNLNPKEFLKNSEPRQELERFTNYLFNGKNEEEDYYFDEDIDDVDIDFTIKNMEDIEDELKDITDLQNRDQFLGNSYYYNESYDLFIEMEEEFMDFMDHIIFDENLKKQDKEYYLEKIKRMINEVSLIFQDLKEKKEFERELLLDMVNAYGIEQITDKKDLISEIFEEIDMTTDLNEIYEISEDKILNDYKNWYKDLIFKKGKSMKEVINN